jgi:hypothetical protein
VKASGRYTHSEIKAYNCGYTGTNGNVDKLFNIIGGLSGFEFDAIGPSDCYTVNGIVGPIPEDVTVTSPYTTDGFLGLGVQPPQSSWGTLIQEGANNMETSPWLLLFPGALFIATLLALNTLGDALRDALDPKSNTAS